jgi:PKD repeat protein
MSRRRVAVTAALALSLTALSPLAAHAASAGTYYVSADTTSCDDSGPGTSTEPFCTIQQAAATATSPGDTVLIGPGEYAGEVDITASGTASAPITFEAATPPPAGDGENVDVEGNKGSDAYGLYLNGASYVDLTGFDVGGYTGSGHSVELENSSHDTVSEFITQENIVLAGDSGADTVSRVSVTDFQDEIGVGGAIEIDSSGTGNLITTNMVTAAANGDAGITIDGSADAAVTSNTVTDYCGAGIAVGDDANGVASGATIENNVISTAVTDANDEGSCAAATTSGISVQSAADESGLTENYNVVYPADSVNTEVYDWAGTTYQTPAALDAATGQGAADSIANPEVAPFDGLVSSESSSVINGANSNAPGEQSTDIDGHARVYDPNVPETGAGTPGYDRGAEQFVESLGAANGDIAPATAPSGAPVTISALKPIDTWANATYTYTYDFGDGSAKVTTTDTSVTHTYASTGKYTITIVTTSDYGASTTVPSDIKILAPVTFAAALTPTTDGGLGLDFSAPVTSDWPLTTETLSFGDGTLLNILDESDVGEHDYNYHLYAEPGTYTLTLTVADAGGDKKTVTQSFTTAGNDYFAYDPTRLLDTRKGLGGTASQLTNDGSIKLKIAGNGSIPANVTAVDLNLTVVGATGNGYIQANKGSGSTGTSNLNYRAGATYSNSVVAPVAADGTITLQNFGVGKSVTPQLIADVSGYFAASAGSGYTALPNAARIMDTRSGVGGSTGKLAAGKTDVLTIAGADGGTLPSSGITAVALNVTATDTSDSGFLTVYGDGSAVPGTSNLNWQGTTTKPASVVAPVGADGKIDITNGSDDGGSADVLVDVSGYFTDTAGGAVYVPVSPARVLDTRKTAKLGANSPYRLILDGVAGLGNATGYVLNATVTDTEASGWLAAGSGSTTPATTSNLNWSGADQTTANLAFASESQASPPAYSTLFYNGGGTLSQPVDLIVDVMGYFSTE